MITVKKAGLTTEELRKLRDIFGKSEIDLMEKYCTCKDCDCCEVSGLCRDLHSSAEYLSKLLAKIDAANSN